MHEGDILASQLADGNSGARGYFVKRVEMMLQNPSEAHKLHEFMKAWWPHYLMGVRASAHHRSP